MKLTIKEAPITSTRGTHYYDSELYYIDIDDIFGGGKGEIYSEDDFISYWNDNKNDDPILANYSSYKDWFNDTVSTMETAYGYELNESIKKKYSKKTVRESVNIMPDLVYDNLALLGYCCTLAANDLHHIHLCAEGDKFQEIHSDAEDYMGEVKNLGDLCLELAREGNLELYNETNAYDVIKDSGNDWKVETAKSYTFREAYTAMSNILSDLTQFITIIEDMEDVKSDVISELDTYARTFSKAVNYFIAQKLGKDDDESDVDDEFNAEECYKSHMHESHRVRKNKLCIKRTHKHPKLMK